MADFIIVGGKIKKAKGRFGGESGGHGCGCSFSRRRHLALSSKQLIAAALEELCLSEPLQEKQSPRGSELKRRRNGGSSCDHDDRSHDLFGRREPERVFARGLRPSPMLKQACAVHHNNRKVVVYPDGMRIVSASY
jgi:hypothetical protein